MDAFRTLTGGSRFDRKRFHADIVPFTGSAPQPAASTSAAVPDELDFFAAPPTKPVEKDRKRKRTSDAPAEEAIPPAAPAPVAVDYAALLRQHKIKLTGLDLPDPVASLDDLVHRAPHPALARRLAHRWRALGLRPPTPIQMAAWGTLLAGRDLLACAPTGSGKTLAFLLPLLTLLAPSLSQEVPSSSVDGTDAQAPSSSAQPTRPPLRPRAVVIEPTRELALQVLREARRLAAAPESGGSDSGDDGERREWKIAVLGEEGVGVPPGAGRGKKKKGHKKAKKEVQEESGAGEAEVEAEGKVEVAAVSEADQAGGADEAYTGPIDLLITTPLRLVFAIQSGAVALSTTSHLVLDEADKLFELNFLEQTDEILAACDQDRPAEVGPVRKAMLSATLPSSVEELAKGVMAGAGAGMVRAIVGHKEAATATIDQSLLFVNTEDHKLLSLRDLITGGTFTPPVLIFVQSIQRAKELANELVLDGIHADAIHADRSATERDEVVARFAKGEIWCLICTDVMSRGVDFKGVKLVINYDFPQSAMSYIHRIGRTGRAGKSGRAVTFFTKADAGHLKTIVNVMRASGCPVSDWMLALPNPSQDAKKALKLRPIGRKDIARTQGSGAAEKKESGATGERKVQGEKRGRRGKVRVLGGKEGVFKKRKGESGTGAGAGAGAAKAEGETKAEGEKKEAATARPGKKAKREVALDE